MKRIAFFLLYLLILLLSIITFIEKSRGTPFVLEHFYGSWWFALLWGILALTGMLCFSATNATGCTVCSCICLW